MSVRTPIGRFFVAAALVFAVAAAGCGEGTVVFGVPDEPSDTNDNVEVSGTIDDVTPPPVTRQLVVFVYTNLSQADLFDGPPFNATGTEADDVEAELVSDTDDFTIGDVRRGALTVIFLLDDPEPDSRVDPGDEYAVLEDEGDLDDVRGGRRVTIDRIDILFESDADGGIATADEITVTRTDDGSASTR